MKTLIFSHIEGRPLIFIINNIFSNKNDEGKVRWSSQEKVLLQLLEENNVGAAESAIAIIEGLKEETDPGIFKDSCETLFKKIFDSTQSASRDSVIEFIENNTIMFIFKNYHVSKV